MNKIVERINWVNDQAPALNDANLNKMDRELDELDDRVISLVGAATEQAEKAEISATNAAESEANAKTSETNAKTSETNADADALRSEGYSLGTQNKQPVGPDSEYYQNNAKYYKEQARQIAGDVSLESLTDVSLTDVQDGDVLVWNAETEKWVNGQGTPTPKEIEITFTVEGAKADNIAIHDSNGAIVGNVIFGAEETSKEVTLTIPEQGGNYTFESSVAKATDGSGGNYRKTVVLNKDLSTLDEVATSNPYMTSNSAPYGMAEVEIVHQYAQAYSAFDGNASTKYYVDSVLAGKDNVWIQYTFPYAVACNRMTIQASADGYLATRLVVYGSNDGFVTDSHELLNTPISNVTGGKVFELSFPNTDYYKTYRVVGTLQSGYFQVAELKFYGTYKAVRVMPEHALYWYGNECGAEWVQGFTTNNSIAITKNTNNISFVANSGDGCKQLVYNKLINVGDYSKLNSVTTRYTGGNYADFDFMLTNSISEQWSTYLGGAPISNTPEIKQIDISAQTDIKYFALYFNKNSVSNNGSLIALWLE